MILDVTEPLKFPIYEETKDLQSVRGGGLVKKIIDDDEMIIPESGVCGGWISQGVKRNFFTFQLRKQSWKYTSRYVSNISQLLHF